jgi:hypothetical protein
MKISKLALSLCKHTCQDYKPKAAQKQSISKIAKNVISTPYHIKSTCAVFW